MSEAPECINGQSIYLYVDRKSLGGKKSRLNESILDLMTTCRVNSKTHGLSTLKLLLSLAFITHNSWLGDEAVLDMNKLPENLNRVAFVDNDSRNVSRVSMYYTEMLNSEGVIDGWMFEFAKNTPTFNFSKAIKNLMLYNKKLRVPREGWKGWQLLVYTIQDLTKMVTEVIMPNIINTITTDEMDKTSLDVKRDNIQSNLICSFENIPCHSYMGSSYFNTMTVGLSPKDTKYVSLAGTAPDVLYNSELAYEYAESTKDWENGLSEAAKTTIKNTPKTGGIEDTHVLQYTIKICQQDISKGVDVRSSIFEQRLQSVISTNQDPGSYAIYNWMVANDDFMNNPYNDKQKPFDSRLSDLHNDIIARMFIYEEVLGILAFHQEMLLLDLNRHGIQTYSDSMYLHLLLCGGQGAGKSNLFKKIQQISIPGTILSISYASKQADNVEDNRNFLTIIHDELPERFYDDADNGGNAQLKEKMSTNRIISMINQPNELTEKREAKMTICESHCMYIGGTNRMWSDIPAPIADRFAGLTMPIYTRPGVTVADMCQRSNNAQSLTAFIEMSRREQALCMYMSKMITIGMLPEPNMSVANRYLKQIFEYITVHGLEVDIRNHLRCMLLARTLTIFNAMRRVFFSGKREGNNPLTTKCFYECIPYLICDEDIAILALTMLREMFVNPNVNRICKSVYDITHLGTKISYASEKDIVTGVKTTDYNYYFVPCNTGANVRERMGEIAKKLNSYRGSHSFAKISVANIMDGLKFLENKYKISKCYTGDSTFIQGKTENLPIFKFAQFGHETGCAFLRDFIDEMKDMNRDLMFEAIKNCTDKFTKDRTVLTAVSFRDGAPLSNEYQNIMYPQILQTIDIKSNPEVESISKNYEYVPLEYNIAIENKQVKPNNDIKPYDVLTENYFDIVFREHCLKHVRDHDPVKEAVSNLLNQIELEENKVPMKYPDDYIRAHSDSFVVKQEGDKKVYIQDLKRVKL